MVSDLKSKITQPNKLKRMARSLIRRSRQGVKTIVWRTVPKITVKYYRWRRSRHSSVVLLIHEGLGDLVALAAGIRELAAFHGEVFVVADAGHFSAIAQICEFPPNVKNVDSVQGKKRNYRTSTDFIKSLRKLGHVIKVGHFDADPVFLYPDSFYLKLGCDPRKGATKFRLPSKLCEGEDIAGLVASLAGPFVFFSAATSDGSIGSLRLAEIPTELAVIAFATDAGLVESERVRLVSNLDRNNFVRSLFNSIYACLKANYIIVSDAGLFNVLIRLENQLDMRVLWRSHPHSLNKEIYGRYIPQ